MRNGSYVDYLFGVATGWLGWPPETAWRTPIPQILMALDARLDWMGGGKPQQQSAPKRKASVADRLKAMLRGQQEP